MESFFQSINITKTINEASFLNLGKGVVDDGLGFLYGDMKTYKAEMEEVVNDLGWEIVSYLMDEDMMESFTDTEYPNGPGADILFHSFQVVKQVLTHNLTDMVLTYKEQKVTKMGKPYQRCCITIGI